MCIKVCLLYITDLQAPYTVIDIISNILYTILYQILDTYTYVLYTVCIYILYYIIGVSKSKELKLQTLDWAIKSGDIKTQVRYTILLCNVEYNIYCDINILSARCTVYFYCYYYYTNSNLLLLYLYICLGFYK